MRNKSILSTLAILMLTVAGFLLLSTANRNLPVSTTAAAEGWPPLVISYYEKGQLSFISNESVGEQTFELDYTDASHWKRTILSSTVEGATGATATLEDDMLTTSQFNETDTKKVEPNFGPNEWLSYKYLANLQNKPTVVLREDPVSGEITAVETFELSCSTVMTLEGVKKCEPDQKNSIVVREFTYRAEDYILTKLVSLVDGAVVEEVTLEKLTFK